jgi:SAM-dependent methyltransferase
MFLKRVASSLRRRVGRLIPWGGAYCVVCGKSSPSFLPFHWATGRVPDVLHALDVVGSDLLRNACPKCECNDRERHLRMYIESMDLAKRFNGARVLHFAPELVLSRYIASLGPIEHIQADLFPSRQGIRREDMLQMSFPDGYFDIFIANHVMEHVGDDLQALREIQRVLRPGSLVILQTPYSAMLKNTFSDPGLTSGDARECAYGQDDHVRLYGQDIFQNFERTGLRSKVVTHAQVLSQFDAIRYGVNPKEPFFLFERV